MPISSQASHGTVLRVRVVGLPVLDCCGLTRQPLPAGKTPPVLGKVLGDRGISPMGPLPIMSYPGSSRYMNLQTNQDFVDPGVPWMLAILATLTKYPKMSVLISIFRVAGLLCGTEVRTETEVWGDSAVRSSPFIQPEGPFWSQHRSLVCCTGSLTSPCRPSCISVGFSALVPRA